MTEAAPGRLGAEKLSDHLMAMIEQANASSRMWVQLYVVVQSGLGLGAGAVIAFWQSQSAVLGFAFGAVPIFLALMGLAFGNAVTGIIVRAHKWQAWWIRRLEDLISGTGELRMFPNPNGEGDAVAKLPAGHNARLIQRANLVVMVSWIAMAAVVGFVMYTLAAAPKPL
jgi:hypothetical protein